MLFSRAVLVSYCQTDMGTDFPGGATLENLPLLSGGALIWEFYSIFSFG